MIDGDPGAQPERTALAWQRTTLASAAIALVSGLTAVKVGHPLLAVLAASVAIGVVLVAVVRFPRGGMPRSGLLRSWPLLLRAAGVAIGMALLGALSATELLVTALAGR